WTEEIDGGNALRPHRVDENIEAGGLDQEAGMTDKGDAQACAVDPRRRPVCIRTRRVPRPGDASATRGPPADQFGEAFWWHPVRVDEPGTVEMIGNCAFVIARLCGANGGKAPRGRGHDA